MAGGSATRLRPLTTVVSKQLLPVYNKPMIYYPLTTLMLSGIRDILLISTRRDTPNFNELLGDGSQFGVSIQYQIQDKPSGIAEALLLGEKFIAGESVALILGDNLLYGPGFGRDLIKHVSPNGATIIAHHVANPGEFGVVVFDENDKPVSLIEKPANFISNWAVPGLYFYDSSASDRARKLTPSSRGELEITDLNNSYLESGDLHVIKMPRGTAWLDLGTPKSLLEAGKFIEIVEERQGLQVGNPRDVAELFGWI